MNILLECFVSFRVLLSVCCALELFWSCFGAVLMRRSEAVMDLFLHVLIKSQRGEEK